MRRFLPPRSEPLSADAPKRAVGRRRLILGAVAGAASVGIAASVVSAATGDGASGSRVLSRQFDLQGPGFPPLHANVQVTVGQGTTKPDACRMVPEPGYVNYPLLMTITNTGSQEWHDSFGGASPKPYLDLQVSDESSDRQTRGEEEIQVPDREIKDECHSFHELGDTDLDLAAHQSFSYQLTVPSLSPDPSKVVFRLGMGAFEGDSDSKAVWTVHLDGHGATYTVPPNRKITPPSPSPSSPTAAPTAPVGYPTVPPGPLCAFLARYYDAQPPYYDDGHPELGRTRCFSNRARPGVSMGVGLTHKDPQSAAFEASTSTPIPTPSLTSGPFVATYCQKIGGYVCDAATQVVPGSTVLVTWVYDYGRKTDPEQYFRDTALRIASELKQYCGTTCPTE